MYDDSLINGNWLLKKDLAPEKFGILFIPLLMFLVFLWLRFHGRVFTVAFARSRLHVRVWTCVCGRACVDVPVCTCVDVRVCTCVCVSVFPQFVILTAQTSLSLCFSVLYQCDFYGLLPEHIKQTAAYSVFF